MGQVISVELTEFGIRSTLVAYSERVKGIGMSADIFGNENSQIAIFGGVCNKVYSNNLTKFLPGPDVPAEQRFEEVTTIDVIPHNN